jgi:hypothetical protein
MVNWNELGLVEGEDYELQDAGDGVFLCLFYQPDENAEQYLVDFASEHFDEVAWCPEPETHGENVFAVLNCFYHL